MHTCNVAPNYRQTGRVLVVSGWSRPRQESSHLPPQHTHTQTNVHWLWKEVHARHTVIYSNIHMMGTMHRRRRNEMDRRTLRQTVVEVSSENYLAPG